jgi:hypothetical protein
MKIYTYVINWDDVESNVLEIEKFLIKKSIPFTVINSGSKNIDSWMNVGDIRYYRQFYTAVTNFDDTAYEYMFWLAGDISSNDWNFFINRTYEVLDKYNVWAYAPYFTNEAYPEKKSKILFLDKENTLSISTNTDGMAVVLHKDLVKELKKFLDYFSKDINEQKITSGWGIAMIWSAISIYNNRLILRDNTNILNHPLGSSYDTTKAANEMNFVLQNFYSFCIKNNIDVDSILKIIEKISKAEFKTQDLFSLNS